MSPGKERVREMTTTILIRFSRSFAACLAFLVAAQLGQAAALPLQQQQQTTSVTRPTPTPDSSSQAATQIAELPQAPGPAPALQDQQPAQSDQQPGQSDQQPASAQNPLGTAAGPTTQPTGVAGTRPAGAAIAPARQRRVRAFFIKTSIIVAAAAAAGAVIALSHASPSRPQ